MKFLFAILIVLIVSTSSGDASQSALERYKLALANIPSSNTGYYSEIQKLSLKYANYDIVRAYAYFKLGVHKFTVTQLSDGPFPSWGYTGKSLIAFKNLERKIVLLVKHSSKLTEVQRTRNFLLISRTQASWGIY
jgi:hypothetical protein